MIFTQQAVEEVKNKDGKNIFSKLGFDLGTFGWLSTAAIGGVVGGAFPLVAFASIAMIAKFPAVIRGISYIKNDVETFIPEYRLLLKNKYLKGHYEDQFKKLAVDYIENSESLLEKRFKAEFITEWLHSSQIYTFELKKSGFSEYSSNLRKTLIEKNMYKDRPTPTEEVDTGVTFGGYCEIDANSALQRKVYQDFKDEGIVGNLIIRGASASHLDSLLALQDYKLTEVDKKIIIEFLDMSNTEYLKKYVDKKISGVYFNQNSAQFLSNNLVVDSEDKLLIAQVVLSVALKVREIEKFVKESGVIVSESPTSVHSGFNVDLDILTESYKKLSQQNQKIKVKN